MHNTLPERYLNLKFWKKLFKLRSWKLENIKLSSEPQEHPQEHPQVPHIPAVALWLSILSIAPHICSTRYSNYMTLESQY